MVTHFLVMERIKGRMKRILDVAELAVPSEKFSLFRKVLLDEFGKNGLDKELRELFDQQER